MGATSIGGKSQKRPIEGKLNVYGQPRATSVQQYDDWLPATFFCYLGPVTGVAGTVAGIGTSSFTGVAIGTDA